MKNLILKNKKLRASFKNSELQSYINMDMNKISRVRNICVFTGRARAINLEYKLSRLTLKKLASEGKIPGFTKI